MNIPHPDNPQHVDNLATIDLLEAQGFEGVDASLAISLLEYDFAWRKLTPPIDGDDYLFIYRLRDRGTNVFDRCTMKSSVSLEREYNWISKSDWTSLFRSHGVGKHSWHLRPFPVRMSDLLRRHGYENIFGSSYWEGFKIRETADDQEEIK